MSGARHSAARDEFFLKLDALVREGCRKWQRESGGSIRDTKKPLRVDYFLREILGGSSRVFWAAARAARANPDKEGIKTEWSFNVFCDRLSRWADKDELAAFHAYFREIYWPAEVAWRERRRTDKEFSDRLDGMIGQCDFTDMLLTKTEVYRFWLNFIRPLYVSNSYADAIGLSQALYRKSRRVMSHLGSKLQLRGRLNLVEVVARTEVMMLNCGDAEFGSLYRDLDIGPYARGHKIWRIFYVGQKLSHLWGGLRPAIKRINEGKWEDDTPLIHLLGSLQGQLRSTRDRSKAYYPRWPKIDYSGDCSGILEALVAREGRAGDYINAYPHDWKKIPHAVEEVEEFILRPEGFIEPHWVRLNGEKNSDPFVKSATEIALARCSIQSTRVDTVAAAKWLVIAKGTLSGTTNHLAWSDFYFWCAKYMRARGNSAAEVLALRSVSRLQAAAGNNEKAVALREEARGRLRQPLIPTGGPPGTDEDTLLTFLESDLPSLAASR